MPTSIDCKLEDEDTGYYARVFTDDPSILLKMIAWVLDGPVRNPYANGDSHGGLVYNGARQLDIGFISPAVNGKTKDCNDPDVASIYLSQYFARRGHDAGKAREAAEQAEQAEQASYTTHD